MKSVFVSFVAVALAAVGVGAQNGLMINTPSDVVECEPIQLSWSGGTGPYYLSVLPGGQPGASALVNFGEVSGTELTWLVNQGVGASLGLTIRDSDGDTNESAPFTVQNGTSDACLTQSLSYSAPGGSSTVVSPPPSSPTSGTTTTSAPPTGPTTSGVSSPSTRPSTSSTTSSSSSSTTSKSAASHQVASFGLAGVFGALVSALLV